MSDETLPDDGYIYMNWLTTAEVVKRTDLSSTRGVIHAVKAGRLRGVKLGTKYRGEWRVDPASADEFKRSPAGRKSNEN